jgi:hypothetical protein
MKKIGLFALATATVACGPSEEQVKREAKNQEVWDAHDVVMPKMDDIMKAEKKLGAVITAMEKDSVMMDSIVYRASLSTSTDLRNAHNEMMDWMHAYEYPGDSIAFDAAMEYMETERIIISEVGVKTDNALFKADSLVQLVNK